MKAGRIVVVVGLGALAACVASEERGAPPSASTHGKSAAITPTRTLASPRVIDWSSQRFAGRATTGMSADDAARALAMRPQAAPLANWQVKTGTGGPVTAPQAVVSNQWLEGSSPSPFDMLLFAADGTANAGILTGASAASPSTSDNVFGLSTLYGAVPTLSWNVAIANPVDRNGVALSLDGTKAFVLDSSGTLNCYKTGWSAGAAPSGGGVVCGAPWAGAYKNASCTTGLNGTNAAGLVNGSSPWIDYESATYDIYFGDNCGYVNHVNGSTGAKVWATQLGPGAGFIAAIESSPVVFSGNLFIGDDMGQLFEVVNATSTTAPVPKTSDILIFNTCEAIGSNAPCPGFTAGASGTPSPWGVRAAIAYDFTSNNVYVASNDYVFELPAFATTFEQTVSSPKHLNSGGTGPMLSEPTLDDTSQYLYTQLNNQLFKVHYPFRGGQTADVYATSLANAHANLEPSSPLPYSNGTTAYTYIGDGLGYMERFDCNATVGAEDLDGVTSSDTPFASGVTTDMTLDYATGNVIFGFSTLSGTGAASGPGGVASFPQTDVFETSTNAYVCPAAKPHLCTGTCSPGGGGDECQQCCSTGDCPVIGQICQQGACITNCNTGGCPHVANSASVCNGDGTCTITCTGTWNNCDGTKATNGCNVDTSADINNCGACGTACSTANIPLPTCTAGVCSGRCADGFVDCDGNRQVDGCEKAASCGACCSSACGAGTICVDPGYATNGGNGVGQGACETPAAGLALQQCLTVAGNSKGTLSCPVGQQIKAITFADYGTPSGTCGQSWAPCENLTLQASCIANASCAWSTASGTCIPSACSGQASAACASAGACTWDSAISACVGNVGYRHYYASTYLPACAQDISQSPALTTLCLDGNSCQVNASNNVYGSDGALDPTAGVTALPLTSPPNGSSQFAANPCPGVPKFVYAQVACDVCGTANLPAGSTCTNAGQCATGNCSYGLCVEPYGGPCSNDNDCNPSLSCDTGTSTCLDGLDIECNGTTSVCASGYTCAATASCGGLNCCISQEGGYCFADSDCVSGDCECGSESGNCSSPGTCGAQAPGVFKVGSGSFTFTPATSSCTSVYVEAWGAAGGGGGGGVGGGGGFAAGIISGLTTSSAISVVVGLGGASGKNASAGGTGTPSTAAAGGASTGDATLKSGAGGGLTTITFGANVIYAGAGGGAGGENTGAGAAGGVGGGVTGGTGGSSNANGCSGGAGGTVTNQGAAGAGGNAGGGVASDKVGGVGSSSVGNKGGGGGGAGLFSGGGGGAVQANTCEAGGGGGASGFAGSITSSVNTQATLGVPGNSAASDYALCPATTGVSTAGAAGGAGCVVIRCTE